MKKTKSKNYHIEALKSNWTLIAPPKENIVNVQIDIEEKRRGNRLLEILGAVLFFLFCIPLRIMYFTRRKQGESLQNWFIEDTAGTLIAMFFNLLYLTALFILLLPKL